MNLIITGGLGHIGSYLIRYFADQDKISSITIVDSLITQRIASLFNLPTGMNYHFIEKDVRELQLSDLNLAGEDTVCIHLAAITDAAASFSISEELFKNNYESTLAVIKLCIENDFCLIFPSTTSVYGTQELLVAEDCLDLKPQSPYAECKLLEEKAIVDACNLGMKGVILRLGTIHGISPGIRFHTAVNKFCYLASTGKPLTVWRSAMKQMRPYLALSDASRAISHVIEKNIFDAEIYNVLTMNRTVEEIVKIIEKTKKVEIEYVENKIMNQLSYEVSSKKFVETGFSFNGDIVKDVSDTMRLFESLDHEF